MRNILDQATKDLIELLNSLDVSQLTDLEKHMERETRDPPAGHPTDFTSRETKENAAHLAWEIVREEKARQERALKQREIADYMQEVLIPKIGRHYAN